MDRPPPIQPPPTGLKQTAALTWRIWVLLGAILAVHALVAITAVADKSVTADEILHVTQGFFADRYGDYRVQPENGILPQRLHGLAAWLTDAPTPQLQNNEPWRKSSGTMIGYQFFYETGHDHFPMLMAARRLNVIFSLGTAVLVFWWGRRLGGSLAGLVAAGIYAFDPNLLAHAALATSDLAAVFFLLGSATLFWRQMEHSTPLAVLASAVMFGLACVAKYSAVLLLPIMLLLIAGRAAAGGTTLRWWRRMGLSLTTHGLAAFGLIWAFYGFRYSGFSPDLPPAAHYAATWDYVIPHIGIHGVAVEIGRKLQLLPEAFLYGYAWVVQSAKARSAFLAGDYSNFGWPNFFPLAFLWKSTLATLLATVLALLTLVLRWRRHPALAGSDLRQTAPLVALFVVYWGFSLTSKLNIGHRHILPTYPILYVGIAACLATWVVRPPWRLLIAGGLIGAQALSCVLAAPHFLAYFNVTSGGSANGYRLLVDSSLDWGQDLPGLSRWLARHNTGERAEPVYLSYFGSGEPNYYGLRAVRLPFVNGFKFIHPRYEPGPGLYCISATMLQQVYSDYRGPWTAAREQFYRSLRAQARLIASGPPASGGAQEIPLRDPILWKKYDELRFARLCHYLRTRTPEAMIGYSILVYRLNEADLTDALGGP